VGVTSWIIVIGLWMRREWDSIGFIIGVVLSIEDD
jgi:hypothetical protein